MPSSNLIGHPSALGCPIKFEDGIKRPFVNWVKVRQRLVEEGFLD